MNDLKILSVEEFPSRELLKTYFLDLAATIRSVVGTEYKHADQRYGYGNSEKNTSAVLENIQHL